MNAVEKISKSVSIIDLMEYYNFDSIVEYGDIVRAVCKIHDGSNVNSFVADLETGLWYCHSCGERGNIFHLVEKMENCSFPEAVNFLSLKFNIDIDGLKVADNKSKYEKELNEWIKFIKNGKKKTIIKPFTMPNNTPINSYLDFNKDTIKHFGLYYIDKIEIERKNNAGSFILRNRYAFPIVAKEQLIGLSLRRKNDEDYPKWFHCPTNINIGDYLYNFDKVRSKGVITVVEGITDVWRCYEAGIDAVCCYGAHITHEQYKLLLSTGADLVFMFDGDDAGRGATEKAIKLLRYKANMEVVELKEGNDPGGMCCEELRMLYENRKVVW